MGARGRKSTSELAVARRSAVIEREERMEPPSQLTSEQAREWREIVDSLPAEHLTRAMRPMLVQLCRHVSEANYLSGLIQQCRRKKSAEAFKEYGKLLTLHERESRIIASLEVRLGLARHTAQYEGRSPGRSKRKPWEFEAQASGKSGSGKA